MNRLATRLAMVIALVAVISILLVIGVQLYTEQRAYRTLPAPFRADLEEVLADPSLTDIEKAERLIPLMRDRLALAEATSEDPRTFMWFVHSFQYGGRALLVGSGLAAIGLGVVLALLLAGYLAGPITAVADAADRVAKGQLSARAPLPSRVRHAGSEVAMLTHNFNVMAESLEQLEEERRGMIADIAHELRTPLTVLQGHIDAMQEGIRPLDHDALDRLDRQTQFLARLVGDLRLLSLADTGRLSLNRRHVRAAQLAEDVTDNFAEQAAMRRISLTCEVEANEDVECYIDPDRIAQVLANLLRNALRHTPEGGQITLKVRQVADGVQFTLRDSGSGLPPEALARVFNRFSREDASRARVSGGSGLGLPIAKALIELHGGNIRAANHLDGGAVFKVFLPARAHEFV